MINIKISKKKFSSIVITIAIFLIEWLLSSYFLNNINSLGEEKVLTVVSIISCISIITHLLTWRFLTGEFICPYIVFLITLFMFCCGQGIGWAFGLDMGTKDMWSRIDHGMTKTLLAEGLRYSILGITSFHIGAISNTTLDNDYNKRSKWTAYDVEHAFKKIGKVLLIICIPAFIAKMIQDVLAVASGGYSAYYVTNQSRSIIMKVLSILSEYYQPCLLVLLVSNRKNSSKRKIIVFAMLVDVIVSLYIGVRSGAVMTMLGIILAYNYFVRPLSRLQVIVGAVGGYFGIGVLNAIANIRRLANRGLTDMIVAFGSSFTNVIGEFVGELGWSITSLCWTMNLVPSNEYGFRYGMSYIVSLISWVPSTFFGARHPTVIWGNLADWLQNSLRMGYGPGYTMVAEAYVNFGYFGLLALLIEGMIVSKFICQISHWDIEKNLLGATFQIMFIMTIMKSLVRSSTSVATRNAFFVMLPVFILIYNALKKRKRSEFDENRNINLV